MINTNELLQDKNQVDFESIASKEIITVSNCITGGRDHFVNYLREAFLMESGVSLLEY